MNQGEVAPPATLLSPRAHQRSEAWACSPTYAPTECPVGTPSQGQGESSLTALATSLSKLEKLHSCCPVTWPGGHIRSSALTASAQLCGRQACVMLKPAGPSGPQSYF